MSETACSPQMTEDSAESETRAVSKSAKQKLSCDSPNVRFRDAHIEHVLKPGGVMRRYVVLNSQRLRQALGQTRRREIEPLYAKQTHFELRTSELWALAQCEAERALHLLYERVQEVERERAPQAPLRISAPRTPGQILTPSSHEGEACGVLVQILTMGIDVLQPNGEVRRIVDIDIPRALEASGAQLTDTIRVIPSDVHAVTIREERSGSHGEGRRTLRKSRKTYQIVRESNATRASTHSPAVDIPPVFRAPSHSHR